VQIAISALTLDLLLFITLIRTLPPKDAVVSFSFNVFVTLALILGNWTGAEEKEVGLVVIPFAYLIGTSVFLFLHRAGISELQEWFGVSQGVGQWLDWASIGIFFGVNLWLYGWENWFVGVAIAWHSIGLVYKKLG
jgi:hypothetical protein